MPPQTGATDQLDGDVSFSLQRLFDPYNMDHVPVEKRLDFFKKRNLAHVRHYKAAVKIFGNPQSRTRYIIAPPMETPLKHRIGLYQGLKTFPEPPVINSQLQPQIPQVKVPLKEATEAEKLEEKLGKYKSWLSERKKLREELQNMGLNEKWLQGKCQRTEIESRVLQRLKTKPPRETANQPIDSEKEAEMSSRSPVTHPVPTLCTPTPHGLQVLDKFLQENKLRLLDLFQQVDKNKNWSISKKEFIRCVKEANLPITDLELDDMILALDSDLTDEVEYRELAKGMHIWRRERRVKKRELVGDEISPATTIHSRSSSGKRSEKQMQQLSNNDVQNIQISSEIFPCVTEMSEHGAASESDTKRPTSQKSSYRTDSSCSQHLEPPEMDLRPEQFYIDNEEIMLDLRKRGMDVLKHRSSAGSRRTASPTVIKVGYKPIDDHLMPSTLDPDTAEQVAAFRQKRLKEYYDIIKLCKERNIVLSRKVLDKVLLYPPDKPVDELKKQIGMPGHLFSNKYAGAKDQSKNKKEVQSKHGKSSKSGKGLRSAYPSTYKIPGPLRRQTLSTGRALVSHKVDCWLTFEEYCQLTSRLEARYRQLYIVDDNAFWPGHLLDKMRLCMPPYDGTNQPSDNRHAIFREIQKPKRSNIGYNNDLMSWPISENNYVQYGDCETFQRRLLD